MGEKTPSLQGSSMTHRMLGKLPQCAKICYYIRLHLQYPTNPQINCWFLLLLFFYILILVSQGLGGKLAWMPTSAAQFTFWRFPFSVPVSLETSCKGSEAVLRIRRNRWHLVQNKLSSPRGMQVSSSETVNGGWGGDLRWEPEVWEGKLMRGSIKGLTGEVLDLRAIGVIWSNASFCKWGNRSRVGTWCFGRWPSWD